MLRNKGVKRNQRQRRQRAEEILNAAAAVFARKGFHRATTKEIAAEAGVAEGTIYNYYRSKRDLLLTMLAHITGHTLTELVSRHDEYDDETFLRVLLRDRFELMERYGHWLLPVLYELLTDESLRRRYLSEVILPVVALMLDYMKGCMEAGRFRTFNPRVVLPAIVGGGLLAGLSNILMPESFIAFAGPRPDREELVNELAEFYLHGLLRIDRSMDSSNVSS